MGLVIRSSFPSSSVPTPRQTRQTDNDHTSDQHDSYDLSQIGNRTNYDSAPVDDMAAFYNEVRPTPNRYLLLNMLTKFLFCWTSVDCISAKRHSKLQRYC